MMPPTRLFALARPVRAGRLALLLAVALGRAAMAADAEDGALVFRRCAACHAADERVNRIGPYLIGVVGRTAGTVPDFSYSPALADSAIVWTEANLDAFLADPRGFVPGTRMAFAGLADSDDRADVIAFLASLTGEPPPEPEPDPVEVVATAPVVPLLAQVAARFGAEPARIEPLVRPASEDAAVAAFCAGAGAAQPDLLGIARRLRQAELDACAAGGVATVSEIKLGHAALVLATGRQEPRRDLDLGELWLAFAAVMPGADGLTPSLLARWPEIDPEQPDGALPAVVGMPGARELSALSELGLRRGCLAFPIVEAQLAGRRDAVCGRARRFQRIDLPESELPGALASGAVDLALMTLPGLEASRTALQPYRINGVEPTAASVRDGSYALAQPLYLYAKPARAGSQPGLDGFLEALTAEAGIAGSGDLGALSLVPLARGEREAARETARRLPALALGGPRLLPIPPIVRPNQVWSWASAAEMVLRSTGLPALGEPGTYRCNVVAAHFGSCQPDCAECLNPVVSARSLARALDAYQAEALAQSLIGAAAFAPEAASRLSSAALRRMIRDQRRPVLAQVVPQGRRSYYPTGMRGHFALIVGIAGAGTQARLTVNDPYPYPEASNPYLATGARTGEPGQYAISYGDFRQRLGYRQSVLLR